MSVRHERAPDDKGSASRGVPRVDADLGRHVVATLEELQHARLVVEIEEPAQLGDGLGRFGDEVLVAQLVVAPGRRAVLPPPDPPRPAAASRSRAPTGSWRWPAIAIADSATSRPSRMMWTNRPSGNISARAGMCST